MIKAQNGAFKMVSIQLGDEHQQSLLVVKTRFSRLELYTYTGYPEGRTGLVNFENPNYLPMAEDFSKVEISLPRLPLWANVFDVNEDGIDEIFVIQSNPRKLIVLQKKGDSWRPVREWELSNADLTTNNPLLIRKAEGKIEVFVSSRNGIQVIEYDKEGVVEWLQPREKNLGRKSWWFTDLDSDGDLDLVESVDGSVSPLRWYEAEGRTFRPAVSLSEDISTATVVNLKRSPKGPEIVVLGVGQEDSISYYKQGKGEDSLFGQENLLPLSQLVPGKWASLLLEGKKAIIELERNKPVINLYVQEGGFWRFRKAYPVLQKVKSLAAVHDAGHSLLFWVEGESFLYRSEWDPELGRFSFPTPFEESIKDLKKSKILAMNQLGEDTWWVRQEGKQLVLSILNKNASQMERVEFPGIEGTYETCLWLGDEHLLVKKKFSKTIELCSLVEGKTVIIPTRLKSSALGKIDCFNGALYLTNDGFVQKLDQSAQVTDQIMLEGDYSIVSFVPLDDQRAYALEKSGRHLHRMEMDESGIFRTVERIQIPFALSIRRDPVLGFTLMGSNYINVPSEGSSPKLILSDRLDPNKNVGRGFEKKTIGNIFIVDIDGDGIDEVAAVDYGERSIIVYSKINDTYEEMISWKVFDDSKYPYGQNMGNTGGANPYRMLAFDIDGDLAQDLIMASHDRIVIYLAKEVQK
ncbi:MAG: hypothetical protein JKY51_01130 [Opitutaceae bacterium]|nr:hypothetical protein [Opitutaceae bacterium]